MTDNPSQFPVTSFSSSAPGQPTGQSPTGRYITHFEQLGTGSYKSVYKAIDVHRVVEVAWNTVKVAHLPQREKDRLMVEVDVLKSLKHGNIIEYYDHWLDDKQNLVFITELMTSGTLKNYLMKVATTLHPSAIKNWCRQILDGLHYLHTRLPKIIHRDLKLENVFVNGNHGQVKIGDLGLCAILSEKTAKSVVGSPEWMAPECFDESYNELIDIWSFGMCVLEMATQKYPYQGECYNPAQIYNKIISGARPASLAQVQDIELKCLIELCLLPKQYRPSAKTLLTLPFFDDHGFDSFCEIEAESQRRNIYDQVEANLGEASPAARGTSKNSVVIQRISPNGIVYMNLKLELEDGSMHDLEFPFDVNREDAELVAQEMANEFSLSEGKKQKILCDIKECVAQNRLLEGQQPLSPLSQRPFTPDPPTPGASSPEHVSTSIQPSMPEEKSAKKNGDSGNMCSTKEISAPIPSRLSSHPDIDQQRLTRFASEYEDLQKRISRKEDVKSACDDVLKSYSTDEELVSIVEADITDLIRKQKEEMEKMRQQHLLAYAKLRESHERHPRVNSRSPDNIKSVSPTPSRRSVDQGVSSRSAPLRSISDNNFLKAPRSCKSPESFGSQSSHHSTLHTVLPGDAVDHNRRRPRQPPASAPDVQEDMKLFETKFLEQISSKPKK
ncbi:hypothetical protein P9112_008090 [Eukaryota sp. TZLM1-RC]